MTGIDVDGYLRWRRAREARLAREAAEAFETTGDPLWLELVAFHEEDLADLIAELARVGNGA